MVERVPYGVMKTSVPYRVAGRDSDGNSTELTRGVFSRNYGMRLSNNGTDSDHDIDISAGRRRDTVNNKFVDLPSSLTKQIDAAWVEGTDQGGLDTGMVAADTQYNIFLITKDADGTVDALFSASFSPTVPAGWSLSNRIGSLVTDASANFRQFRQAGKYFYLVEPEMELDYSLTLGLSASSTVTHDVVLSAVPSGFDNAVLVAFTAWTQNSNILIDVGTPLMPPNDLNSYRIVRGTLPDRVGLYVNSEYLLHEEGTIRFVNLYGTTSGGSPTGSPDGNAHVFRVHAIGWVDFEQDGN